MKHEKTKKLTVLAMLSALAYVVVVVARIPITSVEFLKYEPKDVVIVIGGFLYGPLASLAISVVVSFLEMITVSSTGWIGMVMNIVSTAAFACTAALIYRRKHTLLGAVLGLSAGVVLCTGVMLLWNYLLTPLYMGTSRADVAAMLLPVILPFNLLKSVLNLSITLLLYRPLITGLRKAGLFPKSTAVSTPKRASRIVVWAAAAVLICLCCLAVFLLRR